MRHVCVVLCVVLLAGRPLSASSQAPSGVSLHIRHTGGASVLVFENASDVSVTIESVTLENCVHVDESTWGVRCGEPRSGDVVVPPRQSVNVPVLGSGGQPAFNVSYRIASAAASTNLEPAGALTDTGSASDGIAYLSDMIFPERRILGQFTSTPEPNNANNNPITNLAASGLMGIGAAQSAAIVQGVSSAFQSGKQAETTTSYGYPVTDVALRAQQGTAMAKLFEARVVKVLDGKAPSERIDALRSALASLDGRADSNAGTNHTKYDDFQGRIATFAIDEVPEEFLVRRAVLLDDLSQAVSQNGPTELAVLAEGKAIVDYGNAADYERSAQVLHRYFADARTVFTARSPKSPTDPPALGGYILWNLRVLCPRSYVDSIAGTSENVRQGMAAMIPHIWNGITLPGGPGAAFEQEANSHCDDIYALARATFK